MKHSEQHSPSDFSHYDTYSTEALGVLLNLDLEEPGCWLSIEEVLYISELLVQRNEIEHWFEIPDTETSWQEFTHKYSKEISHLKLL